MANVGTLNAQLGIDTSRWSDGLRGSIAGMKDWTRETERLFSSSAKEVTRSIEREKDAWTGAMRSLRAEIQGVQGLKGNSPGMLGWYGMERGNRGNDVAQQLVTRRRSMLPFGMSQNVSLDMAEASRAAEMGAEMQGGGAMFRNNRFTRGLVHSALAEGGLGPLAGAAHMVENFSGATIGVAAFGVGVAAVHRQAAALGDEIKAIREEAIKLGMTYDQLMAKRGETPPSRFVEGGALNARAGGKGGLANFATAWGMYLAFEHATKFAPALNALDILQGKPALSTTADIITPTAESARLNEKSSLFLQKMEQSQKEAAKAAKEQADAMERVRAAAEASRSGIMAKKLRDNQVATYGEQFVLDKEYRDIAKRGGRSAEGIEADLRLKHSRDADTEKRKAETEKRKSDEKLAADGLRDATGWVDRLQKEIAAIDGDKFKQMRDDIGKLPFGEARDKALKLVDVMERVSKLHEDNQRAKEIEEAVKTPQEKFADSVKDIQGRVARGKLGADVAAKFLARQAAGIAGAAPQLTGLSSGLIWGTPEAANAMYAQDTSGAQQQMIDNLINIAASSGASKDLLAEMEKQLAKKPDIVKAA